MEHLHYTPPRRSSRRAAIDANARLTAMLTPARGRRLTASVSSAAEQQGVAVAVEENATIAEFRDDDSPSLSSVESSEEEELECCICLEEPSANNVATIDGCEHKFCLECITKWSETRNICPLCRTRFTAIESAGGVLQQVPDRRPVAAAGRNLVRVFNLEEIARNEDDFVGLRQTMATLQELHRQQTQRLQLLIQERNARNADQIQPQVVLTQVVRLAAEQAVEQGTEPPVEQAAEQRTELNQLNARLEQLFADLRSM